MAENDSSQRYRNPIDRALFKIFNILMPPEGYLGCHRCGNLFPREYVKAATFLGDDGQRLTQILCPVCVDTLIEEAPTDLALIV